MEYYEWDGPGNMIEGDEQDPVVVELMLKGSDEVDLSPIDDGTLHYVRQVSDGDVVSDKVRKVTLHVAEIVYNIGDRCLYCTYIETDEPKVTFRREKRPRSRSLKTPAEVVTHFIRLIHGAQ